MSVSRSLVTALMLAALTLGAAHAVLAGPVEYFEFDTNSALPGNMYGVTPDGEVGFDGAFQQNIPVAYTPKSGNYILHVDESSNTSKFTLSTRPSIANGTACLGFGLGGGNHPWYVSWAATSGHVEESWNGQVQLLRGDGPRPAVSVGVMDIGDERQDFNPGAKHNARSEYVTTSGALSEATWRPIYWTLGLGDGRFRRGFGGLSVPIDDHFKLAAEYDSLGINAGVAWGLNGGQTAQHWDLLGYFGFTKLKQPTFGLTATFN